MDIQVLVVQSQTFDGLKSSSVPGEQELHFVVCVESVADLFFTRSVPKATQDSLQTHSPRIMYVRLRFWHQLLRRIPAEFQLALQQIQNPNELLFLGSSIPSYIQRYLNVRYPNAFVCQVANKGTIFRGLILLQEGSVSPAHALQQLREWRAAHSA